MYTENSTKRYTESIVKIIETIKQSSLKDYVNRALDLYSNIDEKASIADIESRLPKFESDNIEDYITTSVSANQIQALVFHWNYDGGSSDCIAFGSLYESCTYDESGDTDKYNFEMNITTNNCIAEEYADMKVNVMKPWYDLDMEGDIEDDDLSAEINALFTAKFCLCFQKACQNVYNGLDKAFIKRPFHVFIERHGRWPMHVFSLE